MILDNIYLVGFEIKQSILAQEEERLQNGDYQGKDDVTKMRLK